MDVSPIVPGDRSLIEGYGAGGFRISGERYTGSVIVLPDEVHAWRVGVLAEATVGSLDPVRSAEPLPEILLVGCGGGIGSLPDDVHEALRAAGLTVERMDTGAACRTYNVLVSEARRVAAALIAIE